MVESEEGECNFSRNASTNSAKEGRNNIEDFLTLSRYHSNYQGDLLKQEPKLIEIFNYVQNNK